MTKRYLVIISLFVIALSFTPSLSQTILPDESKAINSYLNKNGFKTTDYAEMKVSDQYYSRSLDMEHIYFQQHFLDIPVENAILNTGYKNGELVHANNTFAVNVDIPTSLISSIIPPENGLRTALRHLGLELLPIPAIISSNDNLKGISANHLFDKGQVSRQDIKVSLIWIKDGTTLRLCWESVVDNVNSSSEWYHIAVDAVTGEFVKKYNLYVDCGFTPNAHTDAHTDAQHDEFNHSNSYPLEPNVLTPDSTYTIFDFPLESPNHGNRTVTTRPWMKAGTGNDATTLGWHNDGGTEYTITKGNNVYAQEDQNGNNGTGYSPSSGTLDFNYPLDFNNPPSSNQDASITNLFHACNLIHDILYQYGFDEPAGNFQANNLGRGGAGNDYVLADALDGSRTNNANFATPADGSNPRMQMFLWNSTQPTDFLVNSPGGLNPIDAVESDFSSANKLVNVGPLTGDIVLVTDNTGGTSKACNENPISNGSAINGNIAMIDRGTCSFTEKVKNAQNLGAIAVVVVNSDPIAPPIVMGGTDNSITIPAVMITFDDGAAIKTELLTQAVNITLTGYAIQIYDGSYDNGIIAHEYGHGVSNRLTGGPSNIYCLQNAEQMGEGWSDFITLMLTTDWGTASEFDKNGIGTYVKGQSINGPGIRTYPYTTDMEVNPFTYDDIIGSTSSHFIGSVWATMLWDMTWEIIDIEPIDTDIYHGKGGNNIALQLVMDGMKLQACSPGFVDGRDAILLADELLYGGKYQCAIWNAFARRGLGLSASQGSITDVNDGTEAFDVPVGTGQGPLYVDVSATGSNFGSDWNNAFHSLQDALMMAECKNIDTIHIAEGTYFPFNQRDTSFILRSDLVIMGGFPSGGSLPANRNPVNNPTILSGDIGSVSNTSDNNYHVVYSGSGVTNAVLDGVIIRNGNANGSGDDMEGSAIYNLGELTLIDVNVNNCLGTSKVFNKGSGTVILKGSTILEN